MKLCDPCRNGHHSRCAGEPTFALMCSCRYCSQWAGKNGPFSVPPDKHEGIAPDDALRTEVMTPIEQAREFDKLYHHELDDDWRSVVTTFTAKVDRLTVNLDAALDEITELRGDLARAGGFVQELDRDRKRFAELEVALRAIPAQVRREGGGTYEMNALKVLAKIERLMGDIT